jgi:hypothetical protein
MSDPLEPRVADDLPDDEMAVCAACGAPEDFDMIMQYEHRDDHLRERALYAANVYALNRTDLMSPGDVCDRAEAFYRFLNGEAYGTIQ